MPWSAISVVALAMLERCSCDKVEHDLLACQDQLAKSQPVSAFTLEINNDSFATFQPFNNQYRNNPSPAAHRHGFLVQVGDFAGAMHAYTRIELQFASGAAPKSYLRGDGPPPWVDILCGQTSPDPLTVAEAKRLIPDEGDPLTFGRRFHVDLNPETPLTAMTLWGPQEGLRAWTETFGGRNVETDASQGEHGHAKYFFSSERPCEVRVWLRDQNPTPPPALGAWRATPEVFPIDPSKRVARIVVKEDGIPPTHGGPHQPPWNQ